MTDTTTKVREHYKRHGLTDLIKSALATITSDSEKPARKHFTWQAEANRSH